MTLLTLIKKEFHIASKRIQVFMAVPAQQEQAKRGLGPLDLLKFIQQYRLENSVRNIIILLRTFLTIVSISVD